MHNPFGVYAFVTLVISALIYLTRRDRHRIVGNVDVFKYPAIIAWFTILGPLLATLFFIYILLHSSQKGGLDENIHSGSVVAGVCAVLLFELFGIWTKSRKIKLTQDTLEVSSCFGRRVIPFRDIHKIKVRDGSRTNELDVFNLSGKRVLNVSSSIQDFDELVSLLRDRAPHAEFKQRDKYGTWS